MAAGIETDVGASEPYIAEPASEAPIEDPLEALPDEIVEADLAADRDDEGGGNRGGAVLEIERGTVPSRTPDVLFPGLGLSSLDLEAWNPTSRRRPLRAGAGL